MQDNISTSDSNTPNNTQDVSAKISKIEATSKEAEKSKYVTPKNIIPMVLILIMSISLLAQKSCAQTTVSLCELVELERQINETEALSKKSIQELTDNAPAGDIAFVNAIPKFNSVWNNYNAEKPTSTLQSNPCEQLSSDANFKEKLIELHSNAAIFLNIVEKKKMSLLGEPKLTSNVEPTPDSINMPETEYLRNQDSELKEEVKTVEHFMTKRIVYEGKKYVCVWLNPRSEKYKLDFLWKNDDGEILKSYANAITFQSKHKHKPVILMNAGMFDASYAPLGLFYSNGKKLKKFNTKKVEGNDGGNFYLNPAGLFIVEKSGKAKVMTKEKYLDYLADTTKIQFATQSGPMLVIDGEIHPAFNKKSVNFNIRNGVGVQEDGTIVFVLSEESVTLYEFAEVFRQRFKCQNALYLDGAISKMYNPKLDMKGTSGEFGGMISIFTK
jgi:uncharacterized protein YigE (DUF2233 family)